MFYQQCNQRDAENSQVISTFSVFYLVLLLLLSCHFVLKAHFPDSLYLKICLHFSSHFSVSLIVRAKVTSVHRPQPLKRKESRSGFETLVLVSTLLSYVSPFPWAKNCGSGTRQRRGIYCTSLCALESAGRIRCEVTLEGVLQTRPIF